MGEHRLAANNKGKGDGVQPMQTPTRELSRLAVAGGIAVLAGVAVWQLGIELERGWLRSEDGPALGDTFVGHRGDVSQRA